MRRVLALGAVMVWSVATLSTAAGAQPAPSRSRPARPAATAPPASQEGRDAPVTVDADQLENLQKEGLTVFTGNVRIITKDCRTGTAKRAEYYDAEQRVVLIGDARVWRDDNVVTGERITIYLAEDRSIVEGGRVKGVFYPKNQDEAARPKVPAGQCS